MELDIDGPIPETILTDPARLRQTVTNLVGNALKFTDEGGVCVGMQLLSSGPQPQLSIAISDSGIGMPKDKLDHIFDPFVQADSSVTRKFGGTGLGLAISRRFAQALGGDITVHSELGQGSVFTVTIDTGPLDGIGLLEPEHALEVSEEAVAVSEAGWAFPPARVLVVDDGHENRELVALLLQEAGIQVDEAENGQIGVEKALQQGFDAILMDIQMPVMDGYTATRHLREQGIQTPIVALTANAMKGFEQDIIAAGFSKYLTKPIDIDELMQTLADLFGGQRVASKVTDSRPMESLEAREPQSQLTTPAPPLVSRLASNPRFHAIIEKFAARLDDQLDAMATAWDEKDFDALSSLAHWLKGAGGTVGFDAFTKPAAHLELLAKSKCEEQIGDAVLELRQLASRIVIPTDQHVETATSPST